MAAPRPTTPSPAVRSNPRPLVLLATSSSAPGGEPGGAALVEACARVGLTARFAVWDDDIDWSAASLVAVRSTWDYSRRLPEFLAWAARVEQLVPLLHGAAIFAWNADKRYLLALAEAGVPVVPTATLDDPAALAAAFDRWGSVVIKPRVGASGTGVVAASSPDDPRLSDVTEGPQLVQPLVASVRTLGESSVYVLGGCPVAQVDKVATAAEVRVHARFGGHSTAVPLDPERAKRADAAVAAAEKLTGRRLAYARVDLMHRHDEWLVSELELIEPSLYLDLVPENADRFAAVGRRVVDLG